MDRRKEGPSPFDYVKSILQGTLPIPMTSAYSTFIVNRAVAHHRDTIFIAALLNEYQPTPEQHYSYLFHKVPKQRRGFEKWVPTNKSDEGSLDLELVAKYYQCSLDVAREYLSLLSEDSLETLRSAYGGKE